jgi:hypothetical protein
MCISKLTTSFSSMLCVMEMELDLVLNLINYKFFLEVMKIKGFGNANNQF